MQVGAPSLPRRVGVLALPTIVQKVVSTLLPGGSGASAASERTLPDYHRPVSLPTAAETGMGDGSRHSQAGGRAKPRNLSPGLATNPPLSLMNPLPRIPLFSREGQETGFVEWHKYLENVANLAGWDVHWRLHPVSRIQQCRSIVHVDYRALLKRRFTPVQLTAVQGHSRLQGEESVEGNSLTVLIKTT